VSSQYDSPDPRHPADSQPRPISERRVYRADGRARGEEPPGNRNLPDGSSPRRRGARSRLLAVIVLVLMAVVIALVGIAANTTAFSGPEGTPGTFKLLPITTTTS
jgi:hypothetical protein